MASMHLIQRDDDDVDVVAIFPPSSLQTNAVLSVSPYSL